MRGVLSMCSQRTRVQRPDMRLHVHSLTNDASGMADLLKPQFVAATALQLGSKGFGDPVTFDNAYYTALQQKPWAGAPKDSMAAMIGLPSDKVTRWNTCPFRLCDPATASCPA